MLGIYMRSVHYNKWSSKICYQVVGRIHQNPNKMKIIAFKYLQLNVVRYYSKRKSCEEHHRPLNEWLYSVNMKLVFSYSFEFYADYLIHFSNKIDRIKIVCFYLKNFYIFFFLHSFKKDIHSSKAVWWKPI